MDIKICKLAGSGGAHCNPAWAAWTGRAQVQGQPGVSTKLKVSLGETLSKNKNINIRELRCWQSPCLLQSFKYNGQQHKWFQQMVEVCIIFILTISTESYRIGKTRSAYCGTQNKQAVFTALLHSNIIYN